MTDADRADELRRLLDDLSTMWLRPAEWVALEEQLRAIADSSPEAGGARTGESDPPGNRLRPDDRHRSTDCSRTSSVERVSQVVFEARVQRRFQGGRATSTLPPTKQTSALPWVGLVCGGLLLAVGGALGGGPVLIGVALLGAFVFGIAMAGSRITHSRGAAADEPSDEPPVPMPHSMAAVVDRLRPDP